MFYDKVVTNEKHYRFHDNFVTNSGQTEIICALQQNNERVFLNFESLFISFMIYMIHSSEYAEITYKQHFVPQTLLFYIIMSK